MPADPTSRRTFVKTTGTAFGAAWFAAHLPALTSARVWAREVSASGNLPPLEYLTDEEALVVEAVSARIVPTDDTPGAREARVVYFVDRAFASSLAPLGGAFRAEYPAFVALVQERHPEAASFADLTDAEQDALLRDIEDGAFFQYLRALTAFGMFSDPSHGGNHDEVGWKLIGFEDRHSYTPPFGYYDRGHHGDEG